MGSCLLLQKGFQEQFVPGERHWDRPHESHKGEGLRKEKLAESGRVHSLLKPLQRQREQVLELKAPKLRAAFLKPHEPPETLAFL